MKIDNEKPEFIFGSPLSIKMLEVKHYAPHFHQNIIELLYCLSGSVDLVSSHRRCILNAGDVFSIDPSDFHYIYSDADNILLSVCLDCEKLGFSPREINHCFFTCETLNMNDYQKEPMYQVKDTLLFLALLAYSGELVDPVIYSRSASKLLKILVEHFNWVNFSEGPGDMNEHNKDRFYRIMDYCYDNCSKKITISQLANMEYLNENYFSSFMKRTIFKGFTPMISYFRCYHAEKLLLTTDMNILDIASACGFSDPKYFYSSFIKWWQTTPAQHRKSYESYMEKPNDIKNISSDKAYPFLNNYISEYHFTKMLELHSLIN